MRGQPVFDLQKRRVEILCAVAEEIESRHQHDRVDATFRALNCALAAAGDRSAIPLSGGPPGWRRCRTILVSNAGRTMPELGSPTGRWVGQIFRTLNLVQQQAENSRKRILFGVHNLKQRNVAFWSIDTPISAYGLNDAVPLSPESAVQASNTRTRLNPRLQKPLCSCTRVTRVRVPSFAWLRGKSADCRHQSLELQSLQ
jgi:hypothetical protein